MRDREMKARQETQAAGEGMMMQCGEKITNSMTHTFHYKNSLQAVLLLGGMETGRKQNGLMGMNMYLPSGYTEAACRKRDELLRHLAMDDPRIDI